MDEQPTAVVFTGGDPVDPDVAGHLPPGALIVAADSGIEQAAALGCRIDLAVGDFDSVAAAALEAAAEAGARIERHPAAKDRTDLEIGLDAARTAGARRIVVVGGHGGRLDHFLANALVLCAPAFAGLEVQALIGPALLTVVHHRAHLQGSPGDLVSLLPVGGPAVGVRTEGLLYPLRGEDLAPGTTRGVSNELARPHAHVSIEGGTLLAVQPGVPGTHLAEGITVPGTTPDRPRPQE